MSPRRLALHASRGALGVSLLATAIVLHVPGPSGLGAGAEPEVRGAWQTAGRAARAGASVLPDAPAFLEPLFSDKTIHFAVFAILALFWASGRALDRTLHARGALVVFAVLSIYAGLGELAQAFEGRVAELGDWIANVFGAAFGVIAVGLAHRGVRALRRRDTALPREGEPAPDVIDDAERSARSARSEAEEAVPGVWGVEPPNLEAPEAPGESA